MKKILLSIYILFCLNSYTNAETICEENNYLTTVRTSVKLSSRLAQRYTGYNYTIKNIYDKPVTIKSINLWNDSNGTAAYLSTQKTNKQAREEVWLKAKSLALPTLSLSLVGAGISMPFVSAKNSRLDNNAKKEAKKFDKPNIQNATIKPNEKLNFKTLAVKNHKPLLRMTYINPLTDEDMIVTLKD